MTVETEREFQTDIQEMMKLIIHSFYSNREIFLRELISNSSDAVQKYRCKVIDENSSVGSEDFKITLKSSKEDKVLSIEDNGIGMTEEELHSCLGTIARSGTKAFMAELSKNKQSSESLIGKFGVGFYSAFLVADNVTVFTKHRDCESMWSWKSDGIKGYTVSKCEEPYFEHGTRIVLNMKEDCVQFLEESTLRNIVVKHSQFVSVPIHLWVEKTREVTTNDEEKSEENEEKSENDVSVEDVSVEDVSSESKSSTKTEIYNEWEVVNKQVPIWTRKSSDVSKEEYSEFFKSITNAWSEHALVEHFNVEGNQQFHCLIYFPKQAPFEMFQEKRKKESQIKLYVRRVLVSDNCSTLVPNWLDFVSGVVDSYDIPLNVSREMLQENKTIFLIKRQLVKKCVAALLAFSKDEDRVADYNSFYSQFNKKLKLGVYEDDKYSEKIAELLRFHSSKSNGKNTTRSLQNYIDDMKENQKNIYYMTAENITIAHNSPHIERLHKLG